MPVRHLFWDFDGTLYNSYPQLTRAFLATLREHGLQNAYTPKEALGLLKVSVFHALSRCAEKTGADLQRLLGTFNRLHALEHAFPPYEGLADCLQTLKEAGCRHYLYTHRDLGAVTQLKRDGLWPLFSDAVTRLDGFANKPAPDALLAMLQRNNIRPEEAAMVGDRDIDIDAGHNAGIRGILFDPDGFYPLQAAELRVCTMRELCERVLEA